MLQQVIPEWITEAPFPRADIPVDTHLEWGEYVNNMFMEGLMEEEKPRPETCPICRSYMNADVICDFCGFGKDGELYEALKSAANIREAYAEF